MRYFYVGKLRPNYPGETVSLYFHEKRELILA